MKPTIKSRMLRLVCLARIASVGTASAQVSDAVRAQATSLTEQAAEKYDVRDYNSALVLFSQAYSVYPAPTTGIFVARSQAALNRLVEAIQTYDHVIAGRPIGEIGSEPEPVRQSYLDAESERAALLQKVATIDVTVEGPVQWVMFVDGRRALPTATGSYFFDSGQHHVTIRSAGYIADTRNIATREGERYSLRFSLAPVAPDPPPSLSAPTLPNEPIANATPVEPQRELAPAPPPVSMAEPELPVQYDSSVTHSRPLRTLGFVGIGLGAGAVGVGTIAAFYARFKMKSAEENCVGSQCSNAAQLDLSSARASASIATWSTVLGLGLAATGVTLVVVGGSSGASKSERTAVTIAPGWAGLSRSF